MAQELWDLDCTTVRCPQACTSRIASIFQCSVWCHTTL